MDAEEHVYAVAEQGDHRFRQSFPARTQDLSPFSPPTQPRPSALRASDQLSESVQANSKSVLSPIQKAVRETQTNVRSQTWTLRELLPT